MEPNYNLAQICTPVRPHRFVHHLAGYDAAKTEFLISGFTFGFELHFKGRRDLTVETPNMPSAEQHPEVLWEKIGKEVSLGHVAGPFAQPPFKKYFCSPLGLVPKAGQENKFRMIFNLSAGEPHSVNGCTPKEYRTVKYRDFDAAIEITQKLGSEAKLGISDLEAAFRQTPIRPEDCHLLVFKARGPDGRSWYFVDKCLPFGHCESCQIYQRISNGIAFAVRKLTGKDLVNYIDDFFFADSSTKACNSQIHTFLWV